MRSNEANEVQKMSYIFGDIIASFSFSCVISITVCVVIELLPFCFCDPIRLCMVKCWLKRVVHLKRLPHSSQAYNRSLEWWSICLFKLYSEQKRLLHILHAYVIFCSGGFVLCVDFLCVGASSWTAFLWLYKLVGREFDLSHWSAWFRLCMVLCLSKKNFNANVFLHWSHAYKLPSLCTAILCLLNPVVYLNVISHWSHECGFSPVCSRLCLCRLRNVVKRLSHMSQAYPSAMAGPCRLFVPLSAATAAVAIASMTGKLWFSCECQLYH